MAVDDSASTPDRLDGWKDIAAYLNRSVRTAIRWEKQLGLPVRRLHTAGGEVVYAFRAEIDGWLRLNPPSTRDADDTVAEPNGAQKNNPAATGPLSRRVASRVQTAAIVAVTVVALGVGLTIGIVVGPGVLLKQSSATAANPNAWRLDANSIVILDEGGQELWRHSFDFDVQPEGYLQKDPPPDGHMVLIADIDGDGRREVMIRAAGYPAAEAIFRVFNSDGTPRFTSTVTGEVRFGGDRYAPPFAVARMIVAHSDGKASIIIGAQHVPEFPAVVRMFSSDGRILTQFWTNGHLGVIAPVQLAGRPVIVVGGINNETRRGSLAILDPSTRFAVAPAQTPKYRCTSCPGGPPTRFLLFPQSELGERLGDIPYVTEVLPEADGGLRVRVTHHRGGIPGDPEPSLTAQAYYLLDDQLRLKSVELGNDFKRTLARAAAVNLCEHLTVADVERSLEDVRVWKDTCYVPIERVR